MFPVSVITANTDLTPLQLRTAFKKMGVANGTPLPDCILSPDECLQFWVFMLVNRWRFLEPEQKAVLFEEMLPHLTGLGQKLADRECDKDCPMVVLVDGRYATWCDYQGWLDLQTGQQIEHPASSMLESLAFHLRTLFDRNRAACEAIARSQNNAGDKDTGSL